MLYHCDIKPKSLGQHARWPGQAKFIIIIITIINNVFYEQRDLLKYICNIWKMVRANEKCLSKTFIEVDIHHRMVPLRMFYIHRDDYLYFQGHNIFENI